MTAEVVAEAKVAPRRSRPSRHAAMLFGVLAPLACWAIGVVPTLAVIGGSGGTVIYGPVQAVARPWLLWLPFAWTVVATVRDRPLTFAVASRAALGIGLVVATAGNVGGRYGLVAWLATIAADAALVSRRAGAPRWAPGAAWSAMPLVLGAWAWMQGAPIAVPVAGAAVAVALRVGRTRHPDLAARLDAPVIAAASGVRQVGRRAGVASRRWIADVPRRSRRVTLAVAAAVVATALQAPIFHRYATQSPTVLGSGDFHRHLVIVPSGRFWPLHIPTPHPLFHLSVLALAGPLGMGWSTTVVLTIATALLSWVLVELCRRPFAGTAGLPDRATAAFVVLFVVWESPAVLAHALRVGRPYDWAPSIHMFLSPTEDLLLPFALAMVVLAGAALERAAPGTRHGVLLAGATVAGALAKPSMAMALLPALVLHVATTRQASRAQLRFLATWLVLPVVVVGTWQTWFLRSGGGTDLPTMAVVVRPFDTIHTLHIDQASPLLFSALLVVPLAAWIGGRLYLSSPTIRLAGWSLLAGYAYLLLVNETGARSHDGTFAKPAYVAGAVLCILSWRFVAGAATEAWRTRRRTGEPWPRWWTPVVVFAAISLAAGTIGYLESLGLVTLASKVG